MSFVVIHRSKNEIDAASVKGFLKNGGINEVIIQADTSQYVGRTEGVPAPMYYVQVILVPEEEAERAKELLKKL